MNEDKLLTTEEASALLGISPFTLRDWRLKGKGPSYIKMESVVKYKEKDIKSYIELSTVAVNSINS